MGHSPVAALPRSLDSGTMETDGGPRSFWLVQLAGWGAYGLATFLTFLTTVDPERWWGLFQFKALVRPAAGIAVSAALVPFYRRLDRDAAVIGGAVLGSVAAGFAWYVAAAAGIRAIRGGEGPLIDWARLPHAIPEYVFVMLAWSAAYFGVRVWRRSRERERAALEAEARATEARLRTLASQLEPHFLFNALSSLRGLIRRDPERAERTVTRLAAFLRAAVVQPTRREVPLEEDLEVVEAYLEVERARIGDALEVEVDVEPDALDRAVPAFLLHPLVENALKYGSRPRVTIRGRVDEGRLRLEVANPGTLVERRPAGTAGTGVGLENLRERLRHTHPGRHTFELVEEAGEVRARIEIETGGRDGEAPA